MRVSPVRFGMRPARAAELDVYNPHDTLLPALVDAKELTVRGGRSGVIYRPKAHFPWVAVAGPSLKEAIRNKTADLILMKRLNPSRP